MPLTLTYLEACSLRDTVPEMLAKWEKAAVVLGGIYHFWKEFLLYVCSQFSVFTVATVRAMYIRALGALTTVRDRLVSGIMAISSSLMKTFSDFYLHSDECTFSPTGYGSQANWQRLCFKK